MLLYLTSVVPNTTDVDEKSDEGMSETVQDVIIFIVCCCIAILIILFTLSTMRMLLILGQKTRSTQQRRQYMGTRARPSLPTTDPAIYVSPANLPPPPKYEAMAPPSYEEVVGIHYPNFQPQPITQPITTAMAQTQNTTTNTDNTESGTSSSPPTVLTVTNERAPTSTAVSS